MLQTQTTDTKTIAIRFPGGNRPMEQLSITPGVTTRDVFRTLGLSGNEFVLTAGEASPPFGADEALYGSVPDGALLFVSSSMDAG